MIKKISLITVFVLFAGLLIYGAINRTAASSQKTAGGEGNGSGAAQIASPAEQSRLGSGGQGQQRQGQDQNVNEASQGQGRGQNASEGGLGNQGQGRGQNASEGSLGNQGQGAGQRGQGRLAQNLGQESALEQLTITGTVVQAPQLGVDIILETDEGQLAIGTGPGYLTEQGFLIEEGDALTIDGFWEDESFKPVTITRDADGEAIILRDEWGRAMWSGSQGNGRNRQATQEGL